MHHHGIPLVANHLPVPGGAGKDPGAISEVVDVVNTEQAQADVLPGVVSIPAALAVSIRAPDLVGAGVLGDVPIAGEDKDIIGSGAKRLVIEENVPNTRGRVLGGTEAGSVDKALARSRVGAEKSSQAAGLDGLVAEQLDEIVRIVKRRGKKAIWSGDVAVAATDKGANTGAAERTKRLVFTYRMDDENASLTYRGQTTVAVVAAT